MSDRQPAVASRDSGSRVPLVVRIAVVLAGTVLIWGSIFALDSADVVDESTLGARAMNAAIAFTGAVVLVVLTRVYLDRRSLRGLALPLTREAWRPLCAGIAAFLIPALAGLGVGILSGTLTVTVRVGVADMLAATAVTIVAVLVFEAVPEELIFRGYIFRNLATAMAPLVAVFVQAVLFTVAGVALWVAGEGWHVLGERIGIFFGMGVMLGLIRVISASVWACIGFHWAFQVIAQTLTGTSVTVSGPMVLYVMLPAFALGAAIVSVVMRRRPNWRSLEPDTPAVG